MAYDIQELITQKTKEFSDLIKASLTKEEMVSAFKTMIDYLKRMETRLNLEMGMLDNKYTKVVKDIESNYGNDISSIKEKAMNYCISEVKTMMSEHRSRMTEAENKIASVMDGINGKDGLPGKDGSPDTPQEIVNKVRTLPEESGWKIEDIYQLREELDELRKLKVKNLGGGGLRPNPTGVETPSGDVNGVNKAYTVTFVPQYITLQGQAIYPDNGYTLSSSSGVLTITLDDAPLTNNILRSHY